MRQSEPKPRKLIATSGLTLVELAAKAGLAIETVRKAKATNQWPPFKRTREGLRRALGLNP